MQVPSDSTSVLRLRISGVATSIPILVQTGCRTSLSFVAGQFSGRDLFLVTDTNLYTLYCADDAPHPLDLSPFRDILVLPAGETAKTRDTIAHIHDWLLEHQAGRDAVLVALGGGVTGDIAGFAAATLHRGIALVHIPTSLLAQTDSSIGGKTGVNHPLGKNLIGAFYHPAVVLIDPGFLATLPDEEYTNGMAEVIKYAVTLDDTLADFLLANVADISNRSADILTTVIRRCAALKIDVVERDERESGLRGILNFGHTVGHAIERLSGYTVKHGFAVARGMRVAARLSHRLCGWPTNRVEKLDALLAAFQLPEVPVSPELFDALWDAMTLDKKARRSQPRFSLLGADGAPVLLHPVAREEVYDALFA